MIIIDGNKYWYLEGKLHRVDGPAIEYANGSTRWFLEDKLHRVDGPAIENTYGTKRWYYQGTLINVNSQIEFNRMLKLKAFW
jgi:hypothetical protein